MLFTATNLKVGDMRKREEEILYIARRKRGKEEREEKEDLISHARAKEPSSAPRRDLPRLNVIGIGPHKIAKGTLVRDFLGHNKLLRQCDTSESRRRRRRR